MFSSLLEKGVAESRMRLSVAMAMAGVNELPLDEKKLEFFGVPLHAAHTEFDAILGRYPTAIPLLRERLVAGQIEGRNYSNWNGLPRCMFGTIAIAIGWQTDGQALARQWYAQHDRMTISLAEIVFYHIHERDTPDTNPIAKLVLRWLDAYIEAHPHE